MGKFVLKVNAGGEYHFNLKATNGEIILTSESYTTKAAAKNGIESVIANANAAVEDQTVEGWEKIACPKYQVYTDKGGKTRFRLVAKNGQTIGASEAYEAKKTALNGIESVKKNAADSTVVEE